MGDNQAGAKRPAKTGRKRDHARDAPILDAALQVLAETGYDGMTIDAVAARAGMARATVYRRWASKTELVLAAAARLSATDADLDRLPDTGSYRDDAIAMFVPDTAEDQQIRLQALAGIEPWIELNRVLMQRAVDRGEFPPGDIDTLAQVIPLLCLSRALQQKPITAEFSRTLLDSVIIPALRTGSPPTTAGDRRNEGNFR